MSGIAELVWVSAVLVLGWLLRPRASTGGAATGSTTEVLAHPTSPSRPSPAAPVVSTAGLKSRRRSKNFRRRRRTASEGAGSAPSRCLVDGSDMAMPGGGLGPVHRNVPDEDDFYEHWFCKTLEIEDDYFFSTSRGVMDNDSSAAWSCDSHISNPESTNWTDRGAEINPASGMPMCGALDILGNPYGLSDSIFDHSGMSDSISSSFDDPFDHGSGLGSGMGFDHGSAFDDLHRSSSQDDWHSSSHDW